MALITIIIPVYNEEEVLDAFMEEVNDTLLDLSDYKFELLFINDGSSDKSMDLIKRMHKDDSRIRYIELSRNFGKEAVMLAGFDYARGDAVILIDADLQHPPEVIKEMLYWWETGYEDVYAVRNQKSDNTFRQFFSKSYYRILQTLSSEDINANAGDFRLLDRRCVDALSRLRETERYTKGMYSWIGFKKKEIHYDEMERKAGETKWNFSHLIKLGVDGLTSYSTAPLRMWSVIGLSISGVSFIYLAIEIFRTLFFGSDVAGYPTLLAAILFLGGIQLISLGVIGEYLGRVFIETKERPTYIVRKTSEENKKEQRKERDYEGQNK